MSVRDEEVYGKYAEELIRFASLVVGPHDAADAVSIAVVAALRSPGWPEVRNHRAYLYRAVLNEARMMIRRDSCRRKYEAKSDLSSSIVTVPTPRPEVVARAKRLSPQQRVVVYLTYWEDLAPSTIVDMLDISDGSVRRHLTRGRKNLRKVLDAEPLDTRIRALVVEVVDLAPTPPSFRELEDVTYDSAPRPRQRRNPIIAVSIALLVAFVAVAAVELSTRNGAPHKASIGPAQTLPIPDDCVVTDSNREGCALSPAAAGPYVGFNVRVPQGIPQGLVPASSNLRIYREPLPAGQPPLPPGVSTAALSFQVWAPSGTNLNTATTCSPYVTVRERKVLPGDDPANATGMPPIDLGSGRTIYGTLDTPVTCENDGATSAESHVEWLSDGIDITVEANGINRAEMMQIANSLYN